MNAAQVVEILKRIGVSEFIQDKVQRLVRSACPLAEWKHKESRSTPSLAVKISGANEQPTYTCSACGASGVLPDLVDELQSLSGKQYSEASMLVAEAMKLKGETGSPRRRIRVDWPAPKFAQAEGVAHSSLGDVDLEAFPLLANSELNDAESLMDWLRTVHGIRPMVACQHGLRLHIDPHLKDARVALPVIDPVTGGILELWTWLPDHGRARRILTEGRQVQGRSQEASALFGVECVSPNEPVFLVQSALGAMRLESLRLKNVVAVLGGAVPDLSVLERAPSVFLAFDETPEGLILTKQAANALDKPQLYLLRWSDGCRANGKHLRRPEDVESLAPFRVVFEKRIMLTKAK